MSQKGRQSRSSLAFSMARQDVAARAAEAKPEDEEKLARPEVTGAWSMQAARGLKKRLEEVEQEAVRANEVQHQGIAEGKIPILIPEYLIDDLVGTDRIGGSPDGKDEDSFRSLVQNIKQRGLRSPIRVRPMDPEWRPNAATPRDVSGQRFALQSGRRRLAACRELGIQPLCFLSFADRATAHLDDLQERFYENAVRKDLSQIERLYSIGLIARETKGASQAQIAEIIGVSRPSVNRAVGVVEFFDELRARLDIGTATRDEIDEALKDLRAGTRTLSDRQKDIRRREQRSEERKMAPSLPFRRKETSLGTLSLSRSRNGALVAKIEIATLEGELLTKLLKVLEGG